MDNDFQVATLHAADLSTTLKQPANPLKRPSVIGTFDFVKPLPVNEQVTITPLLTPDPGVHQGAMLELINSVEDSLYILLSVHSSHE